MDGCCVSEVEVSKVELIESISSSGRGVPVAAASCDWFCSVGLGTMNLEDEILIV